MFGNLLYVALVLYGCYKAYVLADYIKDTSYAEYYVWQEDYGVYEVGCYDVNNITFYYPIDGDRVGYEPFPSSNIKVDGLEFRGEDIRKGFIRK
jgi:hypothetical protein